MTRAGGGWITDGRAKAIRADCEASLTALDGLPIDLYLVHAPDPRTPWRTTVRALARLVDDGLVRRVGVSNVNRQQLDEALELAPVAAVQVALSPFDDRALRGGVVERCEEHGIAVIAHSPLGGPRRAGGLARNETLAEVAEKHDATAAEVALAWLLSLSAVVVAIPGARRPETARSAAGAASLTLDDGDRETLARALGRPRSAPASRSQVASNAEVVLVMGVPGAGKSRVAEEYDARGYLRLNRDERGGTLRELAQALEQELASGTRRVVLDNTYLTRATRSYVIETASRHGVPARCVWLDTPLAQAQVNLVERLLERFGSLPTPGELRVARDEPGVLRRPHRCARSASSSLRRRTRASPPSNRCRSSARRDPAERVSSSRPRCSETATGEATTPRHRTSSSTGARTAAQPIFPTSPSGWPPRSPARSRRHSVPTAAARRSAGAVPLPGLPLAFARAHGVDPARSTLVGNTPAHRTLATALAARYVVV